MKNINQVKTIHTALTREKERLMGELTRLNLHINRKVESVKKIMAYYRDYSEGNHLDLSKTVPILSKNLDFFSSRMLEIIKIEENEIANLMKHRGSKLSEIEKIENKIRLMNHFSDKITAEVNLQRETQEQMNLDELTTIKHTRGNHE
jgi:flagellar biosynthesis chaperone FliJ